MLKKVDIVIDGVTYPVIIEYKRIRNSYFRYKEGTFYITSTYLVPVSSLLKSLKAFAPKLLKKKSGGEVPYSFIDNYVYIFGKKEPISDRIIDEKSLKKYLRKELLIYLNNAVAFYKEKMSINNIYKVKVRDMKSRHGSNSRKTMSLTFQLGLIHFSKDIIDSVIIHELAHDKVFNHSKKFYDEVYNYCPNYKELKRRLDKGIYQ